MHIKFKNAPQDAYSTCNNVPQSKVWKLITLISSHFNKLNSVKEVDPLISNLSIVALRDQKYEFCICFEVKKDESESDLSHYLWDRLKTKVTLVDYADHSMEWNFKYQGKTYPMITDNLLSKAYVLSESNSDLSDIVNKL